jgi:RND superfamily putative drug exporter
MKLLGDWNWYLPRWMRWLPQVSPDSHRRAQPEAEPARA